MRSLLIVPCYPVKFFVSGARRLSMNWRPPPSWSRVIVPMYACISTVGHSNTQLEARVTTGLPARNDFYLQLQPKSRLIPHRDFAQCLVVITTLFFSRIVIAMSMTTSVTPYMSCSRHYVTTRRLVPVFVITDRDIGIVLSIVDIWKCLLRTVDICKCLVKFLLWLEYVLLWA